MGLSGVFLKKRQEIEFPQIVEEITKMLNRIGYIYRCEYVKSKFTNRDYCIITVLEKKNSEKQFLMYVFEQDEDEDTIFDWIRKGGCLNQVINIENFHDCEDMLLRFAYEYLNKFPNDIFWDDLDWYYTKADIERIMNRPYDKDWCYKNPKDCF